MGKFLNCKFCGAEIISAMHVCSRPMVNKFNIGDSVRDKKTGVEGSICSENNGYYAFDAGSCTIGFFTYNELELLTSVK